MYGDWIYNDNCPLAYPTQKGVTMINQEDLSHFGASIQQANVLAGTTYWKIVEARHADPNREFGGDQHIYIEAIDENGNQLRDLEAHIEQGGQIHRPRLDKGLNEPGTNWPLFRDTQVIVSMSGASDRVGPLHTTRAAYKGGDWHHHTWYIVFQRTIAGGEQPPVVDGGEIPEPIVDVGGPLDGDTLNRIRAQAWNQAGVNFIRESAFARYARWQNLGAPLTNEYDVGGFRAQGFSLGIVYARLGDWENVQHVAW